MLGFLIIQIATYSEDEGNFRDYNVYIIDSMLSFHEGMQSPPMNHHLKRCYSKLASILSHLGSLLETPLVDLRRPEAVFILPQAD